MPTFEIPICKKDGHTSYNNYLPISLLSSVSKVIELLTHSRLITFLRAKKMLYERQIGFTHIHSATHALSAIKEEIGEAFNLGNVACKILLDLHEALDTTKTRNLLQS